MKAYIKSYCFYYDLSALSLLATVVGVMGVLTICLS